MRTDSNGWDECKKDIYNRFDVTDNNIKDLIQVITIMQVSLLDLTAKVAKVEVRRGFVNTITGAVPLLVVVILYLIFKG